MKNQKIGFWKWLYVKAKNGIKDKTNQAMASTMGGIILAVLSLAIGATIISLALIGIPIGVLLLLYGFYQISENAPASD